jgi:Transposase domain (DUF772)
MRGMLTSTWTHIQGFLFPVLREEVGPLTPQHERLVTVLDVARIEAFVQMWPGQPGRPPADRHALARAFVAKAVLNLPTTLALIERLAADAVLRRLCGWESRRGLPSESTFSRAFAEFAESGLPARVHEALIQKTHKDRLVGHISRDATAIEARERPVKARPPRRTRRASADGLKRARQPPRRNRGGWSGKQARRWLKCWRTCQRFATSALNAMQRAIMPAGPATSCISIPPMAISPSLVF